MRLELSLEDNLDATNEETKVGPKKATDIIAPLYIGAYDSERAKKNTTKENSETN